MDVMGMMGSMPGTMPAGMDRAAMQACIEACSACEQACIMCADMVGEDRMHAAMCLNCATMANTTMRMMLRPSGMHAPSMMAMCEAMVTMATACAEECAKHADDPVMAMCAQACRECASACEAMLTSMRAMA